MTIKKARLKLHFYLARILKDYNIRRSPERVTLPNSDKQAWGFVVSPLEMLYLVDDDGNVHKPQGS